MSSLILASKAGDILPATQDWIGRELGELSAVLIPTASNAPGEDLDAIHREQQIFRERFGSIKILDIEGMTEGQVVRELKGDVVLLQGGNTWYARHYMLKSGTHKVLRRLLQEDTIGIGSSAGGHLLTPTIRHTAPYDLSLYTPPQKSTGLGVVPFVTIMHVDRKIIKDPALLDLVRYDLRKRQYEVIELTNYQAVMVRDGERTFVDTAQCTNP